MAPLRIRKSLCGNRIGWKVIYGTKPALERMVATHTLVSQRTHPQREKPVTFERRFHLLLSAVFAILALSSAANSEVSAQGPGCFGGPCVTVLPASHSVDRSIDPTLSTTVAIEIQICHDEQLNYNTLLIDYNGTTIDPSTLSKTGGDSWGTCVYGRRYWGNVTLSSGNEGMNSLSAALEDVNGYYGGDWAFYQYYWPGYTRRTFDVVVTPETWTLERHTSTSGHRARFRIWNRGSRTASYVFTASCQAGAVCSTYTGDTVSVIAGVSYTDSVTFSTSASASDAGFVRGIAKGAPDGVSLYDAGAVDTTTTAVWVVAADPVGTAGITFARRLDVIDPNSCVGLPAGQGTGAVCGHLMMSHALPGVTTRNQYRAPSLLYHSDHASPVIVASVDLTLPNNGLTPDSVVGRLYVNGGLNGSPQKWKGSTFAPGRTRRLSMSFDAVSAGLATGVYPVRFEARRHHGGTTYTDTVSTRAIVVNRSGKPYGAGWSVAGIERITVLSGTEVLWIGGDGSARLYAGATNGPWHPPALAEADSISKSGAEYIRHLPDGSRVRFDSNGNIKAVVSRLSDSTSFAVSGTGDAARVTLIRVPVWKNDSASAFVFTYSGDWLSKIRSPGVGGGRETLMHRVSARVDSITDADGKRVHFRYDSITPDGRMVRRIDRLGAEVHFQYGAARRIVRSKQPQSADLSDSIVYRYRWAESHGLVATTDTATHPDSAYTFFDGARTDVDDHTRFWVTALGTVRRVRNAHGRETRVTHSATYPLLPDTVTGPMGERSIAYYKPTRGLVDSVTTLRRDNLSDASRISTRVSWHGSLPMPLAVKSVATTDSTVYKYSAAGQVVSVTRPGVGADTIEYYTTGDSVRNLYRRSRHATESVWNVAEYDALGNLKRTVSPRGFATTYARDSLGRVVSVTDTLGRVTTTHYDKMDRDTLTVQRSPAVSYTWPGGAGSGTAPAETLFVRKVYDAEGRLVETGRKAAPNLAGIAGFVSVATEYDAAGRPVRQEADGARAKVLTYDPSGLVVAEYFSYSDPNAPSVEYEYDALGRLTTRIAISPGYPVRSCATFQPYGAGSGCSFQFPLWPKAGFAFRAPADTAYFTYDHSDRLTGAHNQYARVYRTWTPGGRLIKEVSQIRTLRYDKEGAQLPETDFASHTYTLNFVYDLVGRRTELRDTSAVRACPSSVCVQSYSYSSATGQLTSVTDPRNKAYSFVYDARGQLDTLHYPGGVWEHPTYDIEGNVTRRLVKNGTYAIVDDSITYDLAGRMVSDTGRIVSNGQGRSSRMAYSGLGHLVRMITRLGSQPTRDEEFQSDALGNQVWSYRHHVVLGNIDNPAERETFYDEYGRFDYSWAPDSLNVTDYKVVWHDVDGRLTYRGTTSNTWGSGQSTEYAEEAHYYDGLGRLASFQRKSNDLQQLSNTNDPSGVIERYRYDALGRRVLVHTNRLHTCNTAGCDRAIRRFVWDGNSLLHEIRQKASDTTASAVVESDSPSGNGVGSGSLNQFGRVYYVHAGGIDRPLGVIRHSSSTLLSTFSPHSNWRGLYEGGTDTTGTLITNTITWPGAAASAFLGVNPPSAPDEWMGSLVLEQADASGLMYRRNRYYDPLMGRFTQPDPIGLAGGLNLYGYAGGDPINFRDPLGLCPDSLSTEEAEACEEREAAQAAELADAQATCQADLRQLAVSIGLTATGVGMFKMVGAARKMASSTTEFQTKFGMFMRNAVGIGPLTAVGVHESGQGGSPNYLNGGWGVMYDLLKAAPASSVGIELGEAAYSCREVRRIEARRSTP